MPTTKTTTTFKKGGKKTRGQALHLAAGVEHQQRRGDLERGRQREESHVSQVRSNALKKSDLFQMFTFCVRRLMFPFLIVIELNSPLESFQITLGSILLAADCKSLFTVSLF